MSSYLKKKDKIIGKLLIPLSMIYALIVAPIIMFVLDSNYHILPSPEGLGFLWTWGFYLLLVAPVFYFGITKGLKV